jgi:hypothetical protein
MIEFDGTIKDIEISGVSSITANEIYSRAKEWEEQNIEYSSPMNAVGKAPLGNGVYTDEIYILTNGWKLEPVAYSAGDIIKVGGSLITDDGSARTMTPYQGDPPVWEFQVATAGIVTVSGSGVTNQDKIDIANLSQQKLIPFVV